FFFFFSSRRRHTRFSRDWSSDVCSSDLLVSHLFNNQYSGVLVDRLIHGCHHTHLHQTLDQLANFYSQALSQLRDEDVFRNIHLRSEERRVGKECRAGWWPDPEVQRRREG